MWFLKINFFAHDLAGSISCRAKLFLVSAEWDVGLTWSIPSLLERCQTKLTNRARERRHFIIFVNKSRNVISENKLFRERLRDELTRIAEFIFGQCWMECLSLFCASFHFVCESLKRGECYVTLRDVSWHFIIFVNKSRNVISENKLFRERLRDKLTGIAELFLVSAEWVVCLFLSAVWLWFDKSLKGEENVTWRYVTFHDIS